jgi:hypothetical protein
MTADMGKNFDGDSFSRSFRLEAPLMPKVGEFKTWKRDFMSFLSIKGAALIPQLALSSSGVPLNPISQRFAHAMLVQCGGHSKAAAQAIASVPAGRP